MKHVKLPRRRSKEPPSIPVLDIAKGVVRTPAPSAVDMSVKIDARMEPGKRGRRRVRKNHDGDEEEEDMEEGRKVEEEEDET